MCSEAQMVSSAKLSNFPQAVPDSAGIPESVKSEVLVAPFNDIEFIENILAEESSKLLELL